MQEADAALSLSKANETYRIVSSPVDGIVIDRKVDPGQTVAATFQTPVMFIIAPELDERVFVHASVDEADIGMIRNAKDREQPVSFTVDAYPDDLFEGKIHQVRLNSTTVQNVVTYTVVVEAPNRELKLLPGMTATLSFHIDTHATCCGFRTRRCGFIRCLTRSTKTSSRCSKDSWSSRREESHGLRSAECQGKDQSLAIAQQASRVDARRRKTARRSR